jgi:hypothetical protein
MSAAIGDEKYVMMIHQHGRLMILAGIERERDNLLRRRLGFQICITLSPVCASLAGMKYSDIAYHEYYT